MSVTERVMAAGDWSITLSSETPRKLLEAINVEAIGFSTLVILPAHLDVRATLMRICWRWPGMPGSTADRRV